MQTKPRQPKYPPRRTICPLHIRIRLRLLWCQPAWVMVRDRVANRPRLTSADKNKMDRDTFDNTIRAFKHRTPFRPFTVAMVDGDRVEIDHPDALVVRDGVALFAAPGGIPVVFDHEGVSQVAGDLADQSSSRRIAERAPRRNAVGQLEDARTTPFRWHIVLLWNAACDRKASSIGGWLLSGDVKSSKKTGWKPIPRVPAPVSLASPPHRLHPCLSAVAKPNRM